MIPRKNHKCRGIPEYIVTADRSRIVECWTLLKDVELLNNVEIVRDEANRLQSLNRKQSTLSKINGNLQISLNVFLNMICNDVFSLRPSYAHWRPLILPEAPSSSIRSCEAIGGMMRSFWGRLRHYLRLRGGWTDGQVYVRMCRQAHKRWYECAKIAPCLTG